MRRRRTLAAGLVLAAVSAAVYRRLAFRPRERAELEFEDGSTVQIVGSPEVDALAGHARDALSAAR